MQRVHCDGAELAAMPAHDRPRERLSLYGASSLGNDELVALVLGGGRALSRARDLLASFGGVGGLGQAMAEELARCEGVGAAGASALVAAFELGRRNESARAVWAETLRHPDAVVAFARGRLRGVQQEHFLVIGLDARQRVRMVRTVGIGSLAQVDVHPREVFRPMIRGGMHSCLLVHNHPSGDASPSEADLELTRRMSAVGKLVGVPVLDHVIVADHASTSLAAEGLLD